MNALFSIGERVICVDSGDHGRPIKPDETPTTLIEGKQYRIFDMRECGGCKTVWVDVGIKVPHSGNIICGVCGHSHVEHSVWWALQTRFVKSEDNHQLEEEIFESMKGVKIEN